MESGLLFVALLMLLRRSDHVFLIHLNSLSQVLDLDLARVTLTLLNFLVFLVFQIKAGDVGKVDVAIHLCLWLVGLFASQVSHINTDELQIGFLVSDGLAWQTGSLFELTHGQALSLTVVLVFYLDLLGEAMSFWFILFEFCCFT